MLMNLLLAASFLAILVFVPSCNASSAAFDVRQHLSTATRYDHGKLRVEELLNEDVLTPPGCRPVHLNLVSRHGTRAPTKKRIKQMNTFADRVRSLGTSSKHAPAWMKEWVSPWHGRIIGGELLPKGELEMFQLAKRVRLRYEDLLKEPYHHDLYVIRSTQVARSAASAVAFGMGLFSGEGTLGPGLHRAFSVISDTRTHDKHLRFYESCQNYQESKAQGMVKVLSMQEDTHVRIAESMKERFKFNITKDDIPIIWFICKQEAAALDVVDRICSLFTVEEIELLEWADDLEVHTVKGYGQSINYRMGIPLLLNLLETIESSIAANQGVPGTDIPHGVERAHFRFAHAETVIPLICLLGLFLKDEEVEKTRLELPLPPPSPPPQSRSWWGSAAAPYGANTMVVLHKCTAPNTNTGTGDDGFFVQVIHNEKSVALPGCNGTHFCPFQMFKDNVVLPHVDKTFESICKLQKKPTDCSVACQLRRFSSKLLGFQAQESDKGKYHSEL